MARREGASESRELTRHGATPHAVPIPRERVKALAMTYDSRVTHYDRSRQPSYEEWNIAAHAERPFFPFAGAAFFLPPASRSL